MGSTCILTGGDKGIRRKRSRSFRNSETRKFTCKVSVSPGIGVRTAIAVSVILSHIIPLYKKNIVQYVRYFGGDKGIRTPGLRIANATLYQLSHIPTKVLTVLAVLLYHIIVFWQ